MQRPDLANELGEDLIDVGRCCGWEDEVDGNRIRLLLPEPANVVDQRRLADSRDPVGVGDPRPLAA